MSARKVLAPALLALLVAFTPLAVSAQQTYVLFSGERFELMGSPTLENAKKYTLRLEIGAGARLWLEFRGKAYDDPYARTVSVWVNGKLLARFYAVQEFRRVINVPIELLNDGGDNEFAFHITTQRGYWECDCILYYENIKILTGAGAGAGAGGMPKWFWIVIGVVAGIVVGIVVFIIIKKKGLKLAEILRKREKARE